MVLVVSIADEFEYRCPVAQPPDLPRMTMERIRCMK